MLSGFNLHITDEQVKPINGSDLSGYNQIQIKNNTKLINLIEAVPIGAIIMYGSDTQAPNENYLPCIGQTVDQLLYPELFLVLNGGPIPDLSSKIVRGLDPARGAFTSEIIPSSQPLPVGSIQACMIDSSLIQSPWLYCNGQSYDPLVYPDLFAVLGSTQVPDLRDRFLRGLPASGRTLGSYQADAYKSHRHQQSKGDSASGIGSEGSASTSKDVVLYNSDGAANNRNFYTEYAGDDETRPKNIAVNYMIYAGQSAQQQTDINCPYYIRCK